MVKVVYFLADDGSYMYGWQSKHIIDELAHHKIQIEIFNPLNYPSYELANKELLHKIKSGEYDLLMSVHTINDLYDDTLIEVGRLGMPRLLLLFDNLLTPYKYLETSKYYDLAMLFNIDSNPIYEKYGCKCIVSAYASNPFFFQNRYTKTINSICFVGTPYGTRSIPINNLIKNNIDLDVYASVNKVSTVQSSKPGSQLGILEKAKTAVDLVRYPAGKKVLISAIKSYVYPIEGLHLDSEYLHLFPPQNLIDMNTSYSNYALSLSYPPCRNTGVLKMPLNIARLRNFEIPMCYGLQISMYYDELAEYFEEGKEIVLYHDNQDFIEKVRYYTDTANETEVNKMKCAARKRAEQDHTWYRRFLPAFMELGIKVK